MWTTSGIVHNSQNNNNNSSQTVKETSTQPTNNHLFLIKNIQTRGSRHQSEKKKQAEGILEVTQDHTFSWANEKISEWSITPPLKICLFLWRQISLTKAIQVYPKAKLTEAGTSMKL